MIFPRLLNLFRLVCIFNSKRHLSDKYPWTTAAQFPTRVKWGRKSHPNGWVCHGSYQFVGGCERRQQRQQFKTRMINCILSVIIGWHLKRRVFYMTCALVYYYVGPTSRNRITGISIYCCFFFFIFCCSTMRNFHLLRFHQCCSCWNINWEVKFLEKFPRVCQIFEIDRTYMRIQ